MDRARWREAVRGGSYEMSSRTRPCQPTPVRTVGVSAIAFVGLAIGCSPSAPEGAPEGVTIYERSSYQGQSRRLAADEPNLHNVPGPCSGEWDDCISSIRVPAGWQAILYEDPNFGGPSLTVTSDIQDLSWERVSGWNACNSRWDNCASSVRVSRQ
jgi:hypothetical protein